MKTIETVKPIAADLRPDYEIARESAKALFDALGIVASCSMPAGAVDEPETKSDKAWPHISFWITFTNAKGKGFSTRYKLGVGHVKWTGKGLPERVQVFVNSRQKNPHVQFVDKLAEAQAAAYLANEQKVRPEAFEVLACVCAESHEARENSFEDWAENFGWNTDSRKAERMHRQLSDQWHTLAALIGRENVQKFAELHNQF